MLRAEARKLLKSGGDGHGEDDDRRLFWGSLIAFAGALILRAMAGGLAFANGSLVRTARM